MYVAAVVGAGRLGCRIKQARIAATARVMINDFKRRCVAAIWFEIVDSYKNTAATKQTMIL